MTARDDWRAAFDASPTRDADFETMSGVPVEPVYGPDDGEFPGQYPYTRGPYASMYRSKLWTMRMFAGFGTADGHEPALPRDPRRRRRRPLHRVRPADADGPRLRRPARAMGEVGKCGVAVDTLADMEDLFAGIDLGDGHHVDDDQLAGGGALRDVRRRGREDRRRARPARRHAAERHPQGVPGAEGVRVPAAPVDAARRATRSRFCAGRDAAVAPDLDLRLPHPRGGLDRRAGARVHARPTASPTSRPRSRPGSTSTSSRRACRFFFNAHIDFFEEIAKYRAARRIWARWMRERYGAKTERSLQLRFHTQTAGVSLTAQQPEVNIARTAIEALAGVLGGTQSLHTNSIDEALALPTEKAARIALRTQQVIAHETGVANVADPLGGSWYVEELTDEMERQAEAIFAHLDELGDGSMLEGVYAGIDNGWFQGEIADAAYEFERKINARPPRRRRRQPLHRRQRRRRARHPPDHRRAGAAADQAAPGGARPTATATRSPRALARIADRRRRSRAQPDAGAHRRGARVRDRGRDHGRARRGLRPLRREAGSLTQGGAHVSARRCAPTGGRWPSRGCRLTANASRSSANVAGRGQLVVMPATGGVGARRHERSAAASGRGLRRWRVRLDARRRVARVRRDRRRAVARAAPTGGAARSVVAKQPAGGGAAPAVSPDGTRVAFVVNQQHVAVAPIDGSAWPVRLSGPEADFCFDPSWSPDGSRVVWHEWDIPAMPWDEGRIVVRDADGSGDAQVVAGGPGISVQQPRFSPDGARLAYLSDETGWLNLWVAAADGSDAKPLVDEEIEHGDPSWGLGQRSYAWSPDGSSIVFTRNQLGFGTVDVRRRGHRRGARRSTRPCTAASRGEATASRRCRSGARTPTQIVVSDMSGDVRVRRWRAGRSAGSRRSIFPNRRR